MTVSTALTLLWDSNSRIGEIIWLSGAAPGEMGDTDMLDDLLGDLADEDTEFHPSMEWVKDCPEDYRDDTQSFHEWMMETGHHGFIFVGEKQVPRFSGDDTMMWEQSWGNYFTKLFYVDRLEDAPALVANWADRQHVRMAEKHLARVATRKRVEADESTAYFDAVTLHAIDVTTIEDEGRAVYE